MKLLRWAVAGASAYVVYKYSIGKKAQGEDVLVSPERAVEKITERSEEADAPPRPKKPRAPAKPRAPKVAKPK
jgi:hypothetical protein